MTKEALKERCLLTGRTPAALLEGLPQLGKIMVILRANGITHERIGPAETVTRDGDTLRITGAAHDAVIDVARLRDVVYDATSIMRDKVYPRLDFADAQGPGAVMIVGLDGADSFAPLLATVSRAPAPVAPSKDRPDDSPAETEGSDAAQTLLEQLCADGHRVEIRATRQGFCQSWHRRIEAVKPAMGFINVMTPDFHLHLKAGTVAAWDKVNGSWIAMDESGAPIGLSLRVAS